MRCPECGFENSGTRLKCAECGTVLRPADPTIEALTPSPADQPLPADGRTIQTMQALPGTPDPNVPPPDAEVIAGRFQVVRDLGEGGMGSVQLAHDTKMGRDVAVKRVLSLDEASRARFRSEARAIAALSHQNICNVYDYTEDGDEPLMVMEYIPGKTLKAEVIDNGALAYDRMVHVARGVGRALEYCHQYKVVHRDIKPANILMDRAGNPKLIDFGLGRQGGENIELTQTGIGMGTLDYASPEQKLDAKNVDHRSDIYSFGLTLYFACTGESPRVMRESRIPDEWRELILKCTEDRPEDRFFSMAELLSFLEDSVGRSSQAGTSKSRFGAEGEGPSCPSCGAVNTPNARFCRKCRAGLFIKCPQCGSEERDDDQFCGQCGFDIPAWKEYEERIRKARQHFDRNEFVDAADEARRAQGLLPERPEAGELLARIEELQGKVRETRRQAKAAQAKGEYKVAVDLFEQLIGLEPDDATAGQALAECKRAFFDQLVAQIEASIDAGKLDTARRNIAKVAASKYAGEAEREILDALRTRIEGDRDVAKEEAQRRFDEALASPGGAGDAQEALEEIGRLGASDSELERLRIRLDDYRSQEQLQAAREIKDWDSCLSLLDVLKDLDVPGDAAAKGARSTALRQSTKEVFRGCLDEDELDFADDSLGVLASLGERKAQIDELRALLIKRRRQIRRRKLLVTLAVLLVLVGGGLAGGWFYAEGQNRQVLDRVLADLASGRPASLDGYIDPPADLRDLLPAGYELPWPPAADIQALIDGYRGLDDLGTRALLDVERQVASLAGGQGALHDQLAEEVSTRLALAAPDRLLVVDGLIPAWGGHPVEGLALGGSDGHSGLEPAPDGGFLLGEVDLSTRTYMDLTDPHGHTLQVPLDAEAEPPEAWPDLAAPEGQALLTRDLAAGAPLPEDLGTFALRVLSGRLTDLLDGGYADYRRRAEELVAVADDVEAAGLVQSGSRLESVVREIRGLLIDEWGDIPQHVQISGEFRIDPAASRLLPDLLGTFPAGLIHSPTGLPLVFVPSGFVADRDVPGAVWFQRGFYAARDLLPGVVVAGLADQPVPPTEEPADGDAEPTGTTAQQDQPAAQLTPETDQLHWVPRQRTSDVAALFDGPLGLLRLPSEVQVWHAAGSPEPPPTDEADPDAEPRAWSGVTNAWASQWSQPVGQAGLPPAPGEAVRQPADHDERLGQGGYLRPALNLTDDGGHGGRELRLQVDPGVAWDRWTRSGELTTTASFQDSELPPGHEILLQATPLAGGPARDLPLAARGDQAMSVKLTELADGRWRIASLIVAEDREPVPLGLFERLDGDAAPASRELLLDTRPPSASPQPGYKKVRGQLKLALTAEDATSGVERVALNGLDLILGDDGTWYTRGVQATDSDETAPETGDLLVVDRAGNRFTDELEFPVDLTPADARDLELLLSDDTTFLIDGTDDTWLLPAALEGTRVPFQARVSLPDGARARLAGEDVTAQAASSPDRGDALVSVEVLLSRTGQSLTAEVDGTRFGTLVYRLIDPPVLALSGDPQIATGDPTSPEIHLDVRGGLGGQVELTSDVAEDEVLDGALRPFAADETTRATYQVRPSLDRNGARTLTAVARDDLGQTSQPVRMTLEFDPNPPIVSGASFVNAATDRTEKCNRHGGQLGIECGWAVCDADAEVEFKVAFDEWIQITDRSSAPTGVGLDTTSTSVRVPLGPGGPNSLDFQLTVADRAQQSTSLIVHTGVARRGARGQAAGSILATGMADDGDLSALAAGQAGTFGSQVRLAGGQAAEQAAEFVRDLPAQLGSGVFGGAEQTTRAALSSDGALVALGGDDGTVSLRAGGSERAELDVGSTVVALAFSQDGEVLAAAGDEGGVLLIDARPAPAQRELGSFEADEPLVAVAAAAPRGGRVAAVSATRLYAWSPAENQGRPQVVTLPPLDRAGVTVALSKDGQRIAVATLDAVFTYSWEGASLGGEVRMSRAQDYTALAFDSSGLFLVAGNRYGKVAVLAYGDPSDTSRPLVTQGVLFEDQSDEAAVTHVAITADGRWAVAGFADGDLRSWQLPSDLLRP